MNSKILYQIIAGAYDLLDVIYFRDYEHSPRRAVLEHIGSQDMVLDLCTGTGTNAIKIARRFPTARVMGVDLSKNMLKVARNKAKKAKVPNAKFYCMDATHTKFKSDCFDKVLLSLVLHETEDALAAGILAEAKRVLKEDGELIVTEWERSKSLIKRLLFLPIELIEPKPFRKFIVADMKAYFEVQGFEIKEYIHCDYSRVLILKKK